MTGDNVTSREVAPAAVVGAELGLPGDTVGLDSDWSWIVGAAVVGAELGLPGDTVGTVNNWS